VLVLVAVVLKEMELGSPVGMFTPPAPVLPSAGSPVGDTLAPGICITPTGGSNGTAATH
jgi:hypothetical protein